MTRAVPSVAPGRSIAVAVPLVLIAGAAQAHTGMAPTGGFLAGLSHPIFGADHLLAMLAVGLWAAHLGGRACWLVPAAFVAVMALGGGLAMVSLGLPAVELMILASVVVLGGLVAARLRMSTALGMLVVAGFALFHGHAHGTEMPAGATGLLYAAGFVLATASLHGAGLALGWLAGRLGQGLAVRAAGGAIATTGLLLMAGV